MKRLFSIFLILLFASVIVWGMGEKFSSAYAAEDDLWGNFNSDTNIQTPQEPRFVSDKEFDEAIKKKNKRIDKWKNILLDKGNKPKGEMSHQSNETEEISKTQGTDASLPIVTIPAPVKLGEGVLPVGHYAVQGENKEGKIYLNLYEANNLIAKIPAQETQDDFNQEEILFANWLPEGDNSIKIIYGSLDFNAYAVVPLAE